MSARGPHHPAEHWQRVGDRGGRRPTGLDPAAVDRSGQRVRSRASVSVTAPDLRSGPPVRRVKAARACVQLVHTGSSSPICSSRSPSPGASTTSPDDPVGADRIGPLRGVRVIRAGGLGPAPFAAMVLADLGADVPADRPTRHPHRSCLARPDRRASRRPRWVGGVQPLRRPQPQSAGGRGRPPVTTGGPELVRRLAGGADVLVEAIDPGVAERFGLGPDALLGRTRGWSTGG